MADAFALFAAEEWVTIQMTKIPPLVGRIAVFMAVVMPVISIVIPLAVECVEGYKGVILVLIALGVSHDSWAFTKGRPMGMVSIVFDGGAPLWGRLFFLVLLWFLWLGCVYESTACLR